MATYRQISEWVKRNFDFVPKTCWIAHVKELHGLPVKAAHNRHDLAVRVMPCPEDKKLPIEAAFRHFKMI